MWKSRNEGVQVIVTMNDKGKISTMTTEYDEKKKRMLVLNVHIDDIEEIQEVERIDQKGEDKDRKIEGRTKEELILELSKDYP